MQRRGGRHLRPARGGGKAQAPSLSIRHRAVRCMWRYHTRYRCAQLHTRWHRPFTMMAAQITDVEGELFEVRAASSGLRFAVCPLCCPGGYWGLRDACVMRDGCRRLSLSLSLHLPELGAACCCCVLRRSREQRRAPASININNLKYAFYIMNSRTPTP